MQRHERKQQPCGILRAHVAAQGIIARLQCAADPNRKAAVHGNAVCAHGAEQNLVRALRQFAAAGENGVDPLCGHKRQQKTQGGAAFTAVERNAAVPPLRRFHGPKIAVLLNQNAEGTQTPHRRFNIRTRIGDGEPAFAFCQRGGKQQPVDERFGCRRRDNARRAAGENLNVHACSSSFNAAMEMDLV